MNVVILLGRLTKDPEVRYTQGDNSTAIARFTIAVDRKVKQEGGQTADFIGCVAFGKTAEFIEKYFTKGRKIAVRGRIQTGSYKNKDGATVYTTDVAVEAVDFADGKPDGAAGTATSEPPLSSDGFMNIPDNIDEDLPFN